MEAPENNFDMKRQNYYSIHKNKKPKKAKYSKPYTKTQIQKMREMTDLFIRMSDELKAKIIHVNWGF